MGKAFKSRVKYSRLMQRQSARQHTYVKILRSLQAMRTRAIRRTKVLALAQWLVRQPKLYCRAVLGWRALQWVIKRACAVDTIGFIHWSIRRFAQFLAPVRADRASKSWISFTQG